MNCQFVVIEDERERKLLNEIKREQVRKVPLKEYSVGSPRYEKLIQAMEMAQKFQMPEQYTFNV